MKKRLMALFICVCMLLTAPVLTGAAVAEEAPQPEQAETSAQAPAAEAAAQSVAYELAEQTVTGTASDGASVSITGLLPVGAAAVIEPVVLGHDEIVAYLGEEQAAQMEQYVAYNISVMIGDAEYVLDETVSVTVTQPALEIAEDTELTVQHVHEDEQTAQLTVSQVDAQITEADEITFETDGFSLYIFVTGTSGGVNSYDMVSVGGTMTLDGRWNAYRDKYHSWKTSNASVVTVSGSGDDATITAVGEGTATITHKMDFGATHRSETWNITVLKDSNAGGSDIYGGDNQYEFGGFNDKQWVNVIASVNGKIVSGAVVTLQFNDNNTLDDDKELGCAITGSGTTTGSGSGSSGTGAWFRHIDLGGTVHVTVSYVDPVTGLKYSATANSSNTGVYCYRYNGRYTSGSIGSDGGSATSSYNGWNDDWYMTGPGSSTSPGSLGYVLPADGDGYGAVNELTVTLKQESGYYLSYNANGGTISVGGITRTSYTVGPQSSKTFTVERDTDDSKFTATRSGYKLLGWSLDAGSSSGEFTRDETFNLEGRKTATLYAIWGLDSVKLTFKTDGHGTLEDLTSTSGTITKNVPKGTDLATLYARGEYPATHPSTGYEFDHWDLTSGTVNSNQTITAVFKSKAPVTAGYTVNYYKDSVAAANLLGSTAQTGVIGSTITVAAGTGEGQLDWHKPAAGYKSGVLQDSSTTVAADGGSAVSVLYEIDPGQTKELSYTVKYVVSGVEKDPYSVTKSVQLLQPDTLSVENIALKAYPGFKYSDNSASLVQSGSSLTGAGTIANGGVISVNYAPTVSSVTLTMHVLGQYADLTRDFTGSLSVGSYVLDGADSAAATPYSLRHGATVTVSDIRSAHTLSVTDLESASGYTLTKVTYTLPGGSATELTVTGSATDAVEIPEGATNVDLYYERALVPDSGVVDGHLGAVYALLGSAAVLCAAYVFLSGRRRREEG